MVNTDPDSALVVAWARIGLPSSILLDPFRSNGRNRSDDMFDVSVCSVVSGHSGKGVYRSARFFDLTVDIRENSWVRHRGACENHDGADYSLVFEDMFCCFDFCCGEILFQWLTLSVVWFFHYFFSLFFQLPNADLELVLASEQPEQSLEHCNQETKFPLSSISHIQPLSRLLF